MADSKSMVLSALMGASVAVVGLGANGSLNVAAARMFRSQTRFVLSPAEQKDLAALLAAHAPEGGSCGPSVDFELVPGGLTAFTSCKQPAKVSEAVPDGATIEAE